MQKILEKIIEKLEEIRVKKTCNKEKCDTKELCRICVVDDAIEIVKQEAEQYNGGWIPCSERLPKYGEQSRGIRSTVLLVDEFRLVDKEVLDSVLVPTEIARPVPYLKLPKFID